MFHRFSVALPKDRGQIKGPGSGSPSVDGNHPAAPQLAKRPKTARACDRCRLHRIKCDEQKPCTQCVGIKVKCVVSYTSIQPLQQNSDSHTNRTKNESPLSIALPESDHSSRSDSASNDTSSLTTKSQDGVWMTSDPSSSISKELLDLSTSAQGVSASSQPAFSHVSAFGDGLFPQLPHPALPTEGHLLVSIALLKSQQSYYLRLYWDECHPLVPVMSEAEFAELDALPVLTMFDECTTKSSLIDAMIALGVQHSHATGFSGRILGLQKQPTQQHDHEASWPGFEYFSRCRKSMRVNTEVTLEDFRCHILMALYFMKGNSFHHAYNLLGITVRKAYISKLHRLPPSHLSDHERTARMQLWSTLSSLDVQCSLQLDMPTAIQKSLVKCPFPTENALARYVSSSHRHASGISPYAYSIHLANLSIILNDTREFVSTADFDDDCDDGAPENHALVLSSALRSLEVWRDQLPSELLLVRFGDTGVIDLDRILTLPHWLQRQTVLMDLHYHNAYVLMQRPFIRLRSVNTSNATSGKVISLDAQQPHVELHIASAFHHATIIVDTIYTVCSSSDILYGWSEILQPLWNSTLTIVAYANLVNSMVTQALDFLTRAQAVFELFSPTCPSAHSARDIIRSLINTEQSTLSQDSCALPIDDSINWDLFTSLLEEPQTSSIGLGAPHTSTDLTSSTFFSPVTSSTSDIGPRDFSSVPMQFGDS